MLVVAYMVDLSSGSWAKYVTNLLLIRFSVKRQSMFRTFVLNHCLEYDKDENGSDSVAVQLADEKHWDDLVIIIAVVGIYFYISVHYLSITIGSWLLDFSQSEK